MAGGLRWTDEELIAYQERQRSRSVPAPRYCSSSGVEPGGLPVPSVPPLSDPPPDSGLERDLQAKIEEYCKEHGYPFFHDRSRKCNVPGFPDLVIALPGGRTLWIELKSKSGRLDSEQKRFRLMLLALGHEWHMCRSFRHFARIVQ